MTTPHALMLVATSVATDTRVLREATTLVAAGYQVHVVGKDVPVGFVPPPGVTVSSAGGSSVFRRGGEGDAPARRLPPHLAAARWALLPTHRNQAFRSWAAAALDDGRQRRFDVVHAHDFTALEVGAALAAERGVPWVYDSHEFWSGRPRSGRPTPVQHARETAVERRLGGAAAAVITVGDGVAEALRQRYGWEHITVVRNTFSGEIPAPSGVEQPTALVYAGRLGPFRDLETVLSTAPELQRLTPPLRVRLVGPADATYRAGLDWSTVEVLDAVPVPEVTRLLAEAGLALVSLADRARNDQLAQPNKLFHAIHAGVPVVAADVPELRRVVTQHGIGVLYRSGDRPSLVAAVREAQARYGELREAVAAARPALSWGADAARLTALYERLVPAPGLSS